MTGPLLIPKGDAPPYYYSNRMARAYLLGLEDVLGKNGVNAVLNFAGLKHRVNGYPPNDLELGFEFRELSSIQQALEDMYGIRGGRGLAMQAGRATFKYGLQDFEGVIGIADLALRLIPLGIKIKIGAETFVSIFNRFSDQIVVLEEFSDHYIWNNERCAVCWGRRTDTPCCHLAVGILKEGLHWVSGGHDFLVEEVACIATGDPACQFYIAKKPIR